MSTTANPHTIFSERTRIINAAMTAAIVAAAEARLNGRDELAAARAAFTLAEAAERAKLNPPPRGDDSAVRAARPVARPAQRGRAYS